MSHLVFFEVKKKYMFYFYSINMYSLIQSILFNFNAKFSRLRNGSQLSHVPSLGENWATDLISTFEFQNLDFFHI